MSRGDTSKSFWLYSFSNNSLLSFKIFVTCTYITRQTQYVVACKPPVLFHSSFKLFEITIGEVPVRIAKGDRAHRRIFNSGGYTLTLGLLVGEVDGVPCSRRFADGDADGEPVR